MLRNRKKAGNVSIDTKHGQNETYRMRIDESGHEPLALASLDELDTARGVSYIPAVLGSDVLHRARGDGSRLDPCDDPTGVDADKCVRPGIELEERTRLDNIAVVDDSLQQAKGGESLCRSTVFNIVILLPKRMSWFRFEEGHEVAELKASLISLRLMGK